MHKEKTYRGVPASQGISIGKAYLYTRRQVNIVTTVLTTDEIENEIDTINNSISISLKELDKIYAISVEKIGEKNSKIFEAQIEILKDSIFLESVIKRIQKEKKSAAFIFNDEIEKLGNIFLKSANDYIKERYDDLMDVKNRVIRNMRREKLVSKVDEESIIFAHELTPADTILFSRRKVKGYGTDTGGVTSHAAIIARALRVPAVVGMKVISKFIATGDNVIIDGTEGIVIVHPSPETLEIYNTKIEGIRHHVSLLDEVADKPCKTEDGKHVEITANIEFVEETDFIRNCGIGLYRTEHLYMEKGDFPSSGEQIQEYTHIAAVTFPKSVTIRTFDLGGDKVLQQDSHKEVNPYLGWRGIRMSLDRVHTFKDQLKALLISSVKKNIKIMLPMISSVDEVRRSRVILEEVKKDLDSAGIYYDKKIPLGIMLEVPSAFVLSEELASEADFFSIGTNDLIQYLLAVDRGNELISGMFQQFHPAVIRALKKIVDSGHKHGIKVSLCGEMASVPLAVPVLIGLEIDELSVLPSVIPEIKQIVRAMKSSEAKALVGRLLKMPTEEEIKNEVEKFFETKIKTKIL
ncbi:MAG: phosphoenolpyruvate--protein phosphotransferase [Ignavibacteria bacterium]|nr:phosphoenolpyruvate--protein phosphotransferase [Ignavibacteria bacterium]